MAILALAITTPSLAAGATRNWDFAVLLDKRPIGTHQFEIVDTGNGRRSVSSKADFEVRILGFTVYRYRHSAQEQWQADCLSQASARTDDDGEITAVTGQSADGGFSVEADSGKEPQQIRAQGCLASFAYWDRAQLAGQSRLLDLGTGRIQPVTVTALPASSIEVHGEATPVTGLRISGLKAPIDVWYTNQRWVGLDTTAEGGRKLTYRLP